MIPRAGYGFADRLLRSGTQEDATMGQIRLTAQRDPTLTLFEPDCLMPEQFASLHRSRCISGERRLMLAVLEDAIQVLHRTAGTLWPRAQKERASVLAWIADDDTRHLFSFRTLCAYLGFNAEAVRTALAKCNWTPGKLGTEQVIGAGRARVGAQPDRHRRRSTSLYCALSTGAHE